MTYAQAEELLERLRAAYPRIELSEPTVGLWLGELRRLDHWIGAAAVESLIAVVKTWPSVAHLNEYVTVAREQAARERREAERHEAERAFDLIERPPLREIPAAVELLERFEAAPLALERGEDGSCDDCHGEGFRFRVGRVLVCTKCARSRLRAGVRLATDNDDSNHEAA